MSNSRHACAQSLTPVGSFQAFVTNKRLPSARRDLAAGEVVGGAVEASEKPPIFALPDFSASFPNARLPEMPFATPQLNWPFAKVHDPLDTGLLDVPEGALNDAF